MNQLESGTSSTVLTFIARTSRRSPEVRERVDDEVVAVRVFDGADLRRVERAIVVLPDRIVREESRRRAVRREGRHRRRKRDRQHEPPRAWPKRRALENAAEDNVKVLAVATAKRRVDAER